VGIVGSTNAWFTSEQKNGVQIIVNVGELKLNLYQKIKNPETQAVTKNEIYSYEQHSGQITTNYIELNGPIVPGQKMPLNLCLENKDVASVPMYVKFTFALFIRNGISDIQIPVVLTTENAPNISFGQKTGAAHNDYYYYQNANKENVLFSKDVSVDLMTHFEIDYNQMLNNDGSLKYDSSDAMYIKLTIEAALINW
jgi:hypothetical protein